MANDVTIVLKAVDRASATLKGTTGNIKGMLTTIGAISGAAIAAGTAIKKIADDTAAYNKQIRELTQVTGTGAEEISRIVQVADDWGIEIGQVRVALSMMNKNGMAPTIENLAALADEYVNTTDKTAFAAKAAKLLGRQYTTLIPMLAKGGDAFRDQAAAIDDSLIATDESIKAARDYEVALDNLQDKVQGLTFAIGNVLIPALSVALTPAVEEVIDGQTYWVQKVGDTVYAYKRLGGRIVDASKEYDQLSGGPLRRAAEAQTTFYNQVNTTTDALEAAGPIIYDYVYRVTDVDKEASRAAQATENFAIGIDKTSEAAGEAAGPVKGYLDGIDRNIASPIANFIEDLKWMAAGGGTIEKAFADVQKALDAGLITPEQADAFAKQLLVAAKDVEVTLDPTKLRAAAADLEDTLGKAAARVATTQIKGTEGIEGALATITGLQYYLNFKFQYSGTPPSAYTNSGGTTLPTGGSSGPNPRAAGGPVMAGVPYLVGERGPELFTPGRSGGITPNNALMGGGDVYADITINAPAGMDVNTLAAAVVARLQAASRNNRAGGYARGG